MSTDELLSGSAEQRAEAASPPETAQPVDPDQEAAAQRVGELQEERIDVAEDAAKTAAEVQVATTVQAAAAGDAPEETPLAAPAPAGPKEASFMDKMSAHFDAAKNRGSNAFMAGLETFAFALTTGGSGLWSWIKETWGKMPWSKKEETQATEENEWLVYREDDEVFSPEDPDNQKLIFTAGRELQEMMSKQPSWIDFAREASAVHGVSAASILAIARFESGFEAGAKASSSSAEGLGQFIKKTWASFIAANPNFSESKPSDPRAALHAIAWYAKKNATDCSIDLRAENASGEVYLAHHEGAAGFKRMKAFQRGELTGDQIPVIPVSYKGKAFPKFGVAKVDTYQDYVTLVTSMAGRVEAVADSYTAQLEASPKLVS